MKQFTTLLKKEFSGYFLSYTAYFVIVLYIFLSMISCFYLGSYFMANGTDLFSFFYFQPQILSFIIPALAMRSWSEEKKTGTLEVLLSYPISYKSLVMAKFLACLKISILMILLTTPIWIYSNYVSNVDNYVVFSAYLGCIFTAAMFCAICCLVSSTNSSPIVSYLVSVFLLWLLINIDYNFITKPLAYASNVIFLNVQGALSLRNHFGAFISAQIGLDNLIYFLTFIIFALILNKYSIEDRKEKSWISVSTAAVLFVVALVLINILSAMLFSSSKADFTSDKKYTLSKTTKEIISNIPKQMDIKVYLSSDIRNVSPSTADYSQFVINYLEKYKRASKGKINIDIRTTEKYSVTEREAKENKISSFVGNNEEEQVYFGAVISNSSGKSQTIANFIPDRKQYLEKDISRAIYNLSNEKGKKIGWVNVLGNDFYDDVIISILKENYDVVKVSVNEFEISNDIDVLVVINFQNASRPLSYAVDQFLMRGRSVLAFVDAINPKMKKAETSMYVPGILEKWGITYDKNIVVTDNELYLKKIAGEANSKNIVDDVSSFNVNKKYINQENLITKSLANIYFSTAALIKYSDDEERNASVLMTTSKESGYILADYVRYYDEKYVKENQNHENISQNLAILVEGTSFSIFGESILKGTEFEKDFGPFLPLSIYPSKFLVVSDVDILDGASWNYFGDAINPYSLIIPNNNIDFLINSIDYLSGNELLLGVGNKEIIHNNKSIAEETRNAVINKYINEIDRLNRDISEKENEVIKQFSDINKQFSIVKIKALESLNKEIGELKEKVKFIYYLITQETNYKLYLVIAWMSIALPIISTLLIFIFMFVYRRIKRKKILEIINES